MRRAGSAALPTVAVGLAGACVCSRIAASKAPAAALSPPPSRLQVGELPGVDIEGGTRLSFFCAYKEMPAEPHAVLVAHHREKHALVLMSIRIDGQIEVLSNSTEAAWDQVSSKGRTQRPNRQKKPNP